MATNPGSNGGGSPGKSDQVEVEWQFDALDLRPVERWLASLESSKVSRREGGYTALPLPSVFQVDRYLDTADWRIGHAGFVLRVRQKEHSNQVTLKGLESRRDKNGLKRRREINEEITGTGTDWLGDAGPVGWRVAAMIGRRALHQVLEVQTQRRPFVLRYEGQDVAEIALDETRIVVERDERPVRLIRVEVELAPDEAKDMEPLIRDLRSSCGLWPAALSKFEAGMLAHGIALPTSIDLGSMEIKPTSTLGEVADAVIRRHLGVLLAREPGTRLGEDPEELHDMRVATRRLRAAFEFFADVLPSQFTVLREELGWLGRILGTVRDLDVQLDRLDDAARESGTLIDQESSGPPFEAFEHLRSLLLAQRHEGRAALLQALDSTRYERLTTGLASLAVQGSARRPTSHPSPAAIVLPDLVMERFRSATKGARRAKRTGDVADFHRLRKRCKRFRYALEFVEGIYGSRTNRYVHHLVALQDALGALQDAEVGMRRLAELACDPDSHLPSTTVFVMGSIAERYRLQAAELMDVIPKRLKLLDDREWQNLAHSMDQRREMFRPDSVNRQTEESFQARPPEEPPHPSEEQTVPLDQDVPQPSQSQPRDGNTPGARWVVEVPPPPRELPRDEVSANEEQGAPTREEVSGFVIGPTETTRA